MNAATAESRSKTTTTNAAGATARPGFGTVLTDHMSVAHFKDGHWSEAQLTPTAPIPMHPAAHVLHYSSTCFEGFKAYRWRDGSVHVFRMDRHIERMRQSARLLTMPEPNAEQLAAMVISVIDRCRDQVPEPPGALYLRPLLFGTMPNIGAASTPTNEASLIVLASPVWDYFSGGMKPLRIYIEDKANRTASHLGMVKTGGNYAAAMGPTLAARDKYKVDQVLFCPGGSVQETGAANFLLIREGHIVTRSLDSTFLHGVTRESLLTMTRDMGFRVEERVFDVAEMLEWVKTGEAALSGTAAVLAGIGTLVHRDGEHRVGSGEVGPVTQRLRSALVAIQTGEAPDRHGWARKI
ncbi:MAG TPA: branched-chain amino acid aminotransferase [Steroidobacteraceae bacterium]|jgi:branched-chain amino acid aminotransferase|nr:branched-chain amino acid aminotransferase [Steroidobacteraceae bacterium]